MNKNVTKTEVDKMIQKPLLPQAWLIIINAHKKNSIV